TVGLEHVNVNTARMLKLFREGLLNLRDIWLDILGAGDLQEVERLAALDDAAFRFPLGLWSRIVYDFALAFHLHKLPREHLLQSLLALYVGKTAPSTLEVEPMAPHEAEAEIEKLCLEFESGKEYLLSRWK